MLTLIQQGLTGTVWHVCGKVYIIPNSMLNGSQKWDIMKEFVTK
ncbi:MAG: hypothetical protein QXH07_06205 [Thermoplasmata archaeon]